jgi:hypothetical protein
MNCAAELARDGAAARVVEAVEWLVGGKLTQKEAWLTRRGARRGCRPCRRRARR